MWRSDTAWRKKLAGTEHWHVRPATAISRQAKPCNVIALPKMDGRDVLPRVRRSRAEVVGSCVVSPRQCSQQPQLRTPSAHENRTRRSASLPPSLKKWRVGSLDKSVRLTQNQPFRARSKIRTTNSILRTANSIQEKTIERNARCPHAPHKLKSAYLGRPCGSRPLRRS
jgi:hypothetical protein